jgi:uncharacterized integral membrane protein
MVMIIVLLILVCIVVVFSVQNASPVAIEFFFWRFEASLAIILFLTVITGMIAGALIVALLKMKPSQKKKAGDI